MPRLSLARRRPGVFTLADRARDQRQWELAAGLYHMALERYPRIPGIWVQYGHALKESGELRDPDKLAQAESAYRKAIALDPSAADPHLQLGHALKLQGKTEEAQAAYLRAFALDPSMPYPLQELSGLGWTEAQMAGLRGAVAPNSRDDDIVDQPRRGSMRRKLSLVHRADSARDARQWERATQLYRKALARNPRRPGIWVQYGHALKESGELRDPDKLARAEIAYRRGIALDPGVADFYVQLGHVLKLQGKTEEAQSAYLRAFALDPSLPYPLDELGRLGWSETHISELRTAIEPAACRQLYVPDLSELRGLKPRGQIAVVLHLFNVDLWHEMREAIERISHPFDLFVSLTRGVSDHIRNTILEAFPKAWIFDFENRGRDIGPFIVLLQSGVLFQYDLVCKLHTKRSPHIDEGAGWVYPHGDTWRRALIAGVLGSTYLVDQIVARFRSDPEVGMVVADGNIFRGHEKWAANEKLLAELLPRMGISPRVRDRSFPGGSIFWIRSSLLRQLVL